MQDIPWPRLDGDRIGWRRRLMQAVRRLFAARPLAPGLEPVRLGARTPVVRRTAAGDEYRL